MPRVIDADDRDEIELGELVEALETGGFDAADEEGFAAFAPHLKRLANNRRFLGDLVVEELKRQCAGQVGRNHYGAQVILLHGGSRKFLIRANFWPAETDSVVVNSGASAFFYHLPHDHNFSFLTVGYLGPGYWSDYYEYDYSNVLGVPGEKADLRFVERSRLSPGKVMLYRAHRDIHSQLPPDSLSVSLNILGVTAGADWHDQYRFDLERSAVAGMANLPAMEPLVRLAAHFGGANGRDLLQNFARCHPSERIRFAAVQAQASAAGDLDARIAVYEQAARRGSGLVAGLAHREVKRLEEGRAWIEAQPAF